MSEADKAILFWLIIKLVVDTATICYLVSRLRG